MFDASSFRNELTAIVTGRVCILGVGNRGRGDDGAGPLLIDELTRLFRQSAGQERRSLGLRPRDDKRRVGRRSSTCHSEEGGPTGRATRNLSLDPVGGESCAPRGQIDAVLIDGGSAPENHLEPVVRSRPDTVLVVDAADFEGEPGDVRLVTPERIGAGGLSTHALSLQMLCDYLTNRHPCRIVMIAIRPENTGLGAEMTPAVRQTVQLLADALSAILRRPE